MHIRGEAVSHRAFANTKETNRMSVAYSGLSSEEQVMAGHNKFGLAGLTAQVCWDANQTVEHTPISDLAGHCDVVGDKPGAVQKLLLSGSKIMALPSEEVDDPSSGNDK